MQNKSGFLTSFGIGHNVDKVEVVFWEDDGTRNKHVTFFYKEVPVGTIPIIDQSGWINFISAFIQGYKSSNYDMATIKELLESI